MLKDTEVVWQLDKCVGTAEDLFYVSKDGEKFWVLITLPEKPARPAPSKKGRAPKGSPWFSVPVAVEYDKTGAVLASKKLSEFVPPSEREGMRQLEKRFKWLAGTVGESGKGPRISDKDQVELETLGTTRTTRLSF